MPDYLFVYGSLRRRSVAPIARRLQSETRYLGEATAQGTLYDLGAYPGAVFGPGGRVNGDVFTLPADGSLLRVLDAYEGLAGEVLGGEYKRILIDVRLARGTKLAAWSYALADTFRRGRCIKSGDWLSACRPKPVLRP